MKIRNRLTQKSILVGAVVLFPSMLVILAAYHLAVPVQQPSPTPTMTAVISLPQKQPTLDPTPQPPPKFVSPISTPNPIPNPSSVLGIDVSPGVYLSGISWVRLSYPTCGWGNLRGSVLKSTIAQYHARGLHVLLLVCQGGRSGPKLLNKQQFNDVAQSYPDAVQCGNEQMKQDVATTYVTPDNFARFYDLCSRAVHAVQPNAPVLMGSLDPQVSGSSGSMVGYQVGYLNQMQAAMNSDVHPGGHWSWRSQKIGLIDSWHNGYPSQDVNNLYGLYIFWAQQFNVDLNSGALGQHLWVIEGTGCFKGCGIDAYSSYQVAVSHILTLISDVQTTMRYHVPFFFFSSRDFYLSGVYWPIGILDANGHAKPLRQDLSMGARKLTMGCRSGSVTVVNQLQLLARMYQGCSLPGNYLGVLTS